MLYKEWLSMREKAYLWLGIYAGLILLTLIVWSPNERFGPFTLYTVYGNLNDLDFISFTIPLFVEWLSFSASVTWIAALFGGADMISDELDKGTLSFLLTKPLSRARIYTTKMLLNVAGLTLMFGLSSGVVFVIDRFQPHPVGLWQAFVWSLLIWVVGVTIILLSGLISVFTRNVLQTIALTVAIPAGFGLMGSIALSVLSSLFIFLAERNIFLPIDMNSNLLLVWSTPALVILACGFFWGGIVAFKRKEF
ncbi:MAG: ABC transporter permease subunit [Chloroflexota bacterium]|nr:ABC transporter permease [Chloroflexota bacterium]